VTPKSIYRTIDIDLSTGDYVVFLTDGIVEALNEEGELLGFDRVSELVQRGCAMRLTPAELLDQLLVDVRRFAGGQPQGDDQTIVVLKVD